MIVYRNNFILTKIKMTKDKQFAFGMLQEDTPRVCFIPHWIVNIYNMSEEDIGCFYDCLFIEQPEKNPMVVGIINEDDDNLCASVPVGHFTLDPVEKMM